MENSRRCGNCNTDVHRAPYAKDLRSKKHLKNVRQYDIFIPEWLFKEAQSPLRKKVEKVYNPITLKQIARDNFKKDDKELDNELDKKRLFQFILMTKN